MAGVAGAAVLFALLALAIGGMRFWRDAGGGPLRIAALAKGAGDALSLRYLGGGHGGRDGCNELDEGFSQARRGWHHLLFYGFVLCFASTCTAFVYDRFLGWPAPYPLLSLPVILGTVGGAGVVAGGLGLAWVKLAADPAPTARSVLGADYGLLALLVLTAGTGLLLLGLRETALMGVLLAVHLGCVLALFATIPYSKMVHGLYRTLALVRHAAEAADPAAAPSPKREPPRFVVTRRRQPG
jgi:citrate/tricarballylate utilization protein